MLQGPVEVYAQLLVCHGGWTADEFRVHRRPCRCRTKHGLVPARAQSLWAAALARTPLAAALTYGTRFLGAHLCSRDRPTDHPRPFGFSPDAVAACAEVTFQRCLTLTSERVNDMRAAGLSLANRSSGWNTFCVATVPYPASILPLPDTSAVRLWEQLATFPLRYMDPTPCDHRPRHGLTITGHAS